VSYDEAELRRDRIEDERRHDGRDPVVLRPLEVLVAHGRLDKALRKLKRKMAMEGVLKETKKRRFHEKPSKRRRRKRAEAARRRRKREKAVQVKEAKGRSGSKRKY
jgi:small subunit ribosomal protein S21